MICGIDEAGRGSLIGPLIICIIYLEEHEEDYLKKLRVRDSKKVTKIRRKILFKNISKRFKYDIIKLEPKKIDEYVLKSSLNKLELEEIVKVLNRKRLKKIYIDSFYSNPNTLKKELKKRLNYDCEIISENRADSKYIIVSAASIIAKVIRDTEIENLKKTYGDFGSGYPSDIKTISFIKEYYMKYKKIPEIVRTSWKTLTKLKNDFFYCELPF